MPIHHTKTLQLPAWAREIDPATHDLNNENSRMAYVVDLAMRNVQEKSGGPFAAAVYDPKQKCIVSIGLNVVETSKSSVAHAEMMAIMLAQEYYQEFRMSAPGLELISSAQPCAMCFGAVFWSGVGRLIYGAGKKDVEAIAGFDEGALPTDWRRELESRGISVSQVERDLALKPLEWYRDHSGLVY